VQLTLRTILAGRMRNFVEVGILEEHKLAQEVRMGLTWQEVGRHLEEHSHLKHRQEQVLT
jgi:hypothetical protein